MLSAHLRPQLCKGPGTCGSPKHPPIQETQDKSWELRGEDTYVGTSENTMKQPTRNTRVPTAAAGRSQPV